VTQAGGESAELKRWKQYQLGVELFEAAHSPSGVERRKDNIMRSSTSRKAFALLVRRSERCYGRPLTAILW